jgi:hypothetical protein
MAVGIERMAPEADSGISRLICTDSMSAVYLWTCSTDTLCWVSARILCVPPSLKRLQSCEVWELTRLQTAIISVNNINHLIVVMVKCGVLFEVRTEFLNTV